MDVFEEYGLARPAFLVEETLSPEAHRVTFTAKLSDKLGFQQSLQLIIDDCQARLDAIASKCEDTTV